jgi:hypothetical protein
MQLKCAKLTYNLNKGLLGIEVTKTARDKKNSKPVVGFLWG